jgi:alpha-tubulin suppressor-like RCC1 family protein
LGVVMAVSWLRYAAFGLLVTVCNANAATNQVGGGADHTCVLAQSGRVYCWGDNSNGQIGNGAGMSNVLAESQPTEIAGGFTNYF